MIVQKAAMVEDPSGPGGVQPERPVDCPAVEGTPRTIAVGYDASPAADRALDRALEEAGGSGGQLVIIAVAAMLFDPEGPQNFGSVEGTPAQMLPVQAPPEQEAALARARERIEPTGIAAEYVWAAGEPARAIADTARERDASLVVVGSTHHGLLGRLFGTDVAAGVERELGAKTIVVE
jgi:nucleotide-binding universal stress UspA family protein